MKEIKKTNREILQEIINEEGIDNISLNEESFIVKFGDIKNTANYDEDDYDPEDYDHPDYYLLDTYIEIPYTFESGNMRLHRGIINEYETTNYPDYWYSGFVHYSDSNNNLNQGRFCFGECGVDITASEIRIEGLDSDKLTLLLVQFHNYLAHSSHPSIEDRGNHKRLDLGSVTKITHTLQDVIVVNDIKYPKTVVKTTDNAHIDEVDYNQPYIEVLKEFVSKDFQYKGETIVPKVVKHHTIGVAKKIQDNIRIDTGALFKYIEEKQIRNITNEVSYKKRITFQDLLHKFPNQPSRVDGSVYI